MRRRDGETGKALHERLRFDTARGEIRDGPRRYVVLRADVLMGLFDRLEEPARRQALEAFGASVAQFGSGSVKAYLAQVGPDQLANMMEAASASLGWGRWELRQAAGRLDLRVANSPFAAASTRHGSVACYPIAGMLQAVAEALWGEGAQARELRCACDAQPRGGECVFEAVPLHPAGLAPSAPVPSSPP